LINEQTGNYAHLTILPECQSDKGNWATDEDRKPMVISIEVKSGTNSKLKSLHIFMDEAPHTMAVRVWSQPLSVDTVITAKGKSFLLINVPFYYVRVGEGVGENNQ
jgi:hypothetical protein